MKFTQISSILFKVSSNYLNIQVDSKKVSALHFYSVMHSHKMNENMLTWLDTFCTVQSNLYLTHSWYAKWKPIDNTIKHSQDNKISHFKNITYSTIKIKTW